MPDRTLHDAAQQARESRVCKALDLLLEHGRVFANDFSGVLSLEIEIRCGGVQNIRLGKSIRDQEPRKAA